MKRMGRKEKSVFACMLSLAMFAQCLSASAVSVGADETAPVTEEKVTDEANGTSLPKDKDTEVTTQKKTADQPTTVKAKKAGLTAPVNPAKVSGSVQTTEGGQESTYVTGVEVNIASSGTAPFDDDDKRGNDSSKDNARIRSYDQMTYEIETSYQADSSVEGKSLYYEITVPDDDNLQLDWSSSGLSSAVNPIVSADKQSKTYSYSLPITTQHGGATETGSAGRTVVFNVLGMHEGQTFQPTVKCWFDGNEANRKPDNSVCKNNSATAQTVTVTSIPEYNIILKKGAVQGINTFSFNSGESKNFIDLNTEPTTYRAEGYKDEKVKGYAVTWGAAVEMRRAGTSKGIRGVEFPDPNEDLTFDVDLSAAYPSNNSNDTTTQWAPLLYRVRANDTYDAGDHIASNEIPGSNQNGKSGDIALRYCYDSGKYTVTQDSSDKTKLHFTVKNYRIDPEKFPKTSLGGQNESYYLDIQKILEGVFTSVQFTVVFPMVNKENEDIQDKLAESGNYTFQAAADNLHAVSCQGTETNSETIPRTDSNTDNISETSTNVVGGHGHIHEVYFSNSQSDGVTTGSDHGAAGSMQNKNNDSDSATQGSQVFFTTCWTEGNASTAYPVDKRTVAVDQLVLLEGDAIDIEKAARWDHDNDNNLSRGYYLYPMYVTADHALSFDETKTLTMDSDKLSYYDTLNEAKVSGHVVGVLLRWRGISYQEGQNTDGTALLTNQTIANVKIGKDYSGKVFSITVQSKMYDTSILQDTASQFTSDETEEAKADAYRAAAKNLLGNGPLCVVNPDWETESNGNMDGRKGYTKQPTYNSSGYNAGEGFERDRGDSLYVVPYYTQITKTIAQKDTNGRQKQTYQFDQGERYADYKLTGSMSFAEDDTNYTDGKNKTTITITDKIPSGLTYVENSAVWGPNNYEEIKGKPGKLTGGQKIEPKFIKKDDDGSVTITWEIPDVAVKSGELPSLYYSCIINKNVNNNTDLKNTATIHSADEKRAICSANKNTSDAGIKITKASGFNIEKSGDHDLELDGSAKFVLRASNSTETNKENFMLVDVMPYDGKGYDGIGTTVMKGKYTVTGLSVNDDLDQDEAQNITVYYTTDKKYAGQSDISQVPLDTVKNWNKADVDSSESADKAPTWKVTGWPTAIAIVDKKLEAHHTIEATLRYDAEADKDDHLVNYLMTQGAASSTLFDNADVVVYDRSLSGTVWIDDNFDGLMGDNEERVPGVKVQLQRQNTDGTWEDVKSYKDKDGNTDSGIEYTDEKGYYEFTRLPAGDHYRVVFTSGDKTNSPKASDLSQYYMTKKDAGTDTKTTSKTVNSAKDGKVEEGDITGISMPTIETMKKNGQQHFNLPDQNMGLYRFKRSLEGTAWFDDNKDGVKNDKDSFEKDITVNLYREDANGKLTKVDSTQTDKNGHYEFKNIDGGDYCVEFVNKKHSTITSMESTDGKMTSIAAETEDEKGNPIGSRIEKIHMPTDAEMLEKKESTYNKPHLDAGFISEKAAPKPSEKPNKPTDTPENPNKPNKPDKPVKPEEPTNPENPVIPENPEKPVVPENPSQPEEPVNPENPTEPENPNRPEKPEKPEKPAKPSNPSGTPKTTPKEPTKKPGKKTDTPKTTPKVTKTPVPSEPTEKPGKKTDTPKTTPKTTGTPEKPAAPSATRHSHYSYVTNNFVTTNNDTTVSSRDDTSVQHTTTGTAPVKTGDHTHAELYLALVILAGAFITGKARKSRKARHK